MENTYNPRYQKLYSQGYTFGLNPIFIDWEDITNVAPRYNNDAFLSGFMYGRKDYERFNGAVSDGIPELVLTEKILENIRMTGKIGMSFDAKGYTKHQLKFIKEYYERGCREYEPDQDISLYSVLAINGIEL
ncbi:MAG TPA: hypothetical protein VGB50_11110 [Flavobacterium sp.]|jgi:hypothetical protein